VLLSSAGDLRQRGFGLGLVMGVSAEVPPDAEGMGVAAAGLEFGSWGWAFRDQTIRDYGIDAHAEPFTGPQAPTGRLLALQLKSGASYFREETDGGWWYRGTNKHLRYWLGHVLPVLIVLYSLDTKTLYWQHVTEDRVEYTDLGWKILIPRDQVLSPEATGLLHEIAASAPGASEDPVASSLAVLSPAAAAILGEAQAIDPDGSMRLARLLARGRDQARLTIEAILAAEPSWLPAAGGRLEAALGAYANEHSHHDLAREALTRAAGHGAPGAGRLYAAASFLALSQGKIDQARDLLSQAEAAGDGRLFTSVVRAALADHDEGAASSPRVAEVLASASQEELADEPVLVVLLGEFAVRRGDLPAALRLFEAAATGNPPSALARLQLAQALIARAASGDSVVPGNDRQRAQELAREVQHEVRRWSGPSEQALCVRLKAHMMIGAFQQVVRLATPESVGGAALDREASFGEVAVWGAEAALAMGDRTRAEGFADLVKGTPAESFMTALLMDPAASVAQRCAAWRAALASAVTREQQRRALYELAALGDLQADDLTVARAAQTVDDVQTEILTARNDAAQGHLDQAVMRLRARADSSSAAAETLEELLAGAGRTDEALTECDRAIGRFGVGKIAHDKLNILAGAGRLAEADAFATQLLAGRDLAPEQRHRLRQILLQNRADQGQWAEVEQMCREALAEYPDDDDFAWGLITAQANQGHLDRAWASFRATTPPVARPESSQLWMGLHARFGFTQQDVAAALDLIDRWPDTPEVGAVVLTGFLDLAGHHLLDGQPALPDLDPGLRERFEAELRTYAQRYPDGPIQMASLEDVDFTSVIRAQFTPHMRPLHHAAAAVRAGRLPLGALAAAAGRPYAAMLAEQACGPLQAVTPDQDSQAMERGTAAQAINGEVVIEASTLAVITLVPERATALLSAFATVRLPRPALMDIDAARSDLTRAPGSTYSLSYDPERDILITQLASLPQHQQLSRRITELDRLARTLTITDAATAEPADVHLPWLAAVDLAAERDVPLWSDDIAIRALAASQGVPAFGTWALLTTLTKVGLIPDTTAEDALTLSSAGVAEIETP
jgi:tetratricopeptide (TPR) repeat protein